MGSIAPARTNGLTPAPGAGPEARVERVEMQIGVVIDALRVLLHGLEEHPSDVPQPERAAAAARHAHQILLTLGPLGE